MEKIACWFCPAEAEIVGIDGFHQVVCSCGKRSRIGATKIEAVSDWNMQGSQVAPKKRVDRETFIRRIINGDYTPKE